MGHPAPTQLLASEGGRLVYFARSGDEHFAVIDGLEGPKFEETGFGPVFSDDYAHVAYAGMRDSSWYIVVDSVEHGPYPAVSYVDFPPGSAEPGYIVEWPDSSRIYLNHQPQATPFKLVRQPVYTVEGALWYFWASDGKRTYVVSGDGQVTNEDLEYYSVSTPWRSAHGNHCVYEMVFDSDFTRKAFVVDGVLQTRIECGGNYTIGFSNDGSHYYTSCFISYPMEATLSVDDTHGPYRGIWIDPVTFSEDSKRWATRVVAKDGPYLVIDGRNVPVEASCSSVHFSQDGRHLAYTISRKKSSEEHLVIDDTDFKAYTEILGEELTFGADGTLTVFARHKDSKLYRVTVSPLSAP